MCNVHFILTLTPPWLQVKVTKYFDFVNLDVWRGVVSVRFSSETTQPISPMMIPINLGNSISRSQNSPPEGNGVHFMFGVVSRLLFSKESDGADHFLTWYDLQEARWVISSNVWTDYNFTWFHFGQLFIWIGANNDQIWLFGDWMSDFEQCSNQFQLDLISLLVNFSYELGK